MYSSYYVHFVSVDDVLVALSVGLGAGEVLAGVFAGLWRFNVLQLPLSLLNWMEGREEHSRLSSSLLRPFPFQTFPGARISS